MKQVVHKREIAIAIPSTLNFIYLLTTHVPTSPYKHVFVSFLQLIKEICNTQFLLLFMNIMAIPLSFGMNVVVLDNRESLIKQQRQMPNISV